MKFFSAVILSFIIIILSRTFIVEFLFPKREISEFRFHFSAAGYLIIAYAISTAFRALQDWFVAKQEKEVLISEKQKAELAVLRHQLSPHFLFNTLNNITELMHKDVNVAEEYVGKLAALLRELLQKEKLEKILLRDELNFVKNYVDLQKIRLNENNKLSFHVLGDPKNLMIEPFILINFVENVFKHGLGDNNKLVIHIKIENSVVELITENTISEYKKDQSGGIGLANIQKRLQLIYPQKHDLHILSTDKYCVNLKIDLA
ncbi:MAG: histidine kinase [Bacteroidia bacterium]|nr:histidine kinase [Bacteroidia bacterium]